MKAKLLLTASALALASSLAFGGQAYAQADQAQTVSVCGTPNNTPVVGQSYAITMDTTAKLCTNGGSSGGAVTVTSGNVTVNGSLTSGGNVTLTGGPYQTAQTPITGHSGNVGNATATATLTGTSSTTTYISGFQCEAGGATAAAIANITVSGVIGGNMTYSLGTPTGVTLTATPLIVKFDPPVPAAAANTTIVVTMTTLGIGNVIASCNDQGFYQ